MRSKVNSGGRPGIPRNTGIRFSRGEYIMFIDSDDAITSTALEELYGTAKDFNADALHCGWWYATEDGTVTTDKNFLKETSWEPVEKPSKSHQVSSKLSARVSEFIADKFWGGTVSNFVKRSLIAANGIKFPPYSVSEDFVFKFQLVCLAENLVRSANIFYVWRKRKDSTCRAELSVPERINRWAATTFAEIKFLDEFMNRFDLFKNLQYKYGVFELLFKKNIPSPHQILPIYAQIPAWQLDWLIRRELSEVKDKTALTAFLFARMNLINVQLLKVQNLLRQQPKEVQDFQRQNEIIQRQQAQIQQLQQQLRNVHDIFN